MLTARDDDAFTRLCRAAGRHDLEADRRFATVEARAENRSELEEFLAALFATRTAPDWESAMRAAGVGCVVADAMSNFAFLYRDEQAHAMAMMTTVEHPSIGTYWRFAPVLTLSDTPSRAPAFCELGEHTRAILAETGYERDEIERLHDDGVVGWLAENATVAQE